MSRTWGVMYIVSGYADGCRQAAGGNVMLLATFCWESTGPAIHVAVTLTCKTDLNIAPDQIHPFMKTTFPHGSGLFLQHNYAPCYNEENCSRMVCGPQQSWGDNYKLSIQSSICGMCWDKGSALVGLVSDPHSFQIKI